ncbi:LysR family transcriptional regulator [Bosea sp. RAC05]|jgi:DNA-binding transcriptional LysR family regulator|uniref:LysR family transcriptional regulator n=1 Tax=Bosea sp. RAC05 TaxID=1842539 RepID=UPI00083D4B14|nr:LysR family transcriptional regulator [Bosea sp. RAC05]AOG06543.1 bacterial regulatory helix-turn-helix, lysR family protein [Bosea sp. RAC05]
MELRHLRYFTTVAAEGSFSRASEKLNIAQPPLSRQIQQLEEELGVRLLDRGRPITLTEPGRYLFEQARQILQRVEDTKAMTRRIAKGMVLQFNIGFVASTLYDALPELIRRFRIAVPGVEVQLLEMTTMEQVAALKDGRIDVGLGRLRFEDESLVRKVVREERLWLAVPVDHPLARTVEKLRLRDTAGEPLIIYPKSPRPSYADQVLDFYREAGVQPQIGMEARELQTALGLVASGGGICVVPASVRRLGRDDVRFIELDEPQMTTPIIMSYRRADTSRLLAQLIALVRDFDQWGGKAESGSPSA